MRKLTLSLATILAMSTFAVAGGDIAPVEPVVETPMVMEAPSTGGLYLGVGYSLLKSDANFFDVNHNGSAIPTINFDDDYSAMMFQAGYNFNPYVSVEARYWVGLTDNSFTITGNTFDSDASAWGVYLKPIYPVTDAFDIYALLGYGSVTVNNVKIGGLNRDFDIDGFSWGVGASYSVTENIAFSVDYVDFQDDDITFRGTNTSGTFNHAFDSINFGVNYQF
jgi:opacity protein-like surface antigen